MAKKKQKRTPKPPQTAKITFTETREGDGYAFAAGETYDLPLPSCQRWVRRNAAVYADAGALETAVVPHEPQQAAAPETVEAPTVETETLVLESESEGEPDAEPTADD